MGTRSNYETVSKVIQAFVHQDTWVQKQLARHVGIETQALRKVLESLRDAQMPLDREEDHPHVYWSVPKRWFPGGVIFEAEDWPALVHAVLQIPEKARREKLLRRLLAGRQPKLAKDGGFERLSRAVAAAPVTGEEHEKVLMMEQALLQGRALSIKYYSTNSGRLDWRTVSPARLFAEPPGRLVALCHKRSQLLWFRIDNMQRVELAGDAEARTIAPETLEAYLRGSIGGFHDGTDVEFSFRVDLAAAPWVRGNLLSGMAIDPSSTGSEMRVVCRGAALVVARFVVGLGGAGAAEGQKLKALVRQLAEESLNANR